MDHGVHVRAHVEIHLPTVDTHPRDGRLRPTTGELGTGAVHRDKRGCCLNAWRERAFPGRIQRDVMKFIPPMEEESSVVFRPMLLAAAAAVATLTFSSGVASAEPTHQSADALSKASPQSGNFTIKNAATGRCVTDTSIVRAFSCNGWQDQIWWIQTFPGSSTVIVKNASTGRCLDDSQAFGLRTVNCNDMIYQNWALETASDGGAVFRNHMTGLCVDDSFAYGIRTHQCYHHQHQSFRTAVALR
ncbi:RICIN domain-containing protein [Streptomyces uncialis]|uniref:RICIN domain-containing protein n=1 Tax=Streptomyces uncialis TaxID=1048205 RepID=UPI00386FFEA7|nr:RICIN domain-containing protein [Streptomyces uncialis]